MRGKVPDWDKEDISAMDIEERIADPNATALDVYSWIEKLAPTEDELVVKAEGKGALADSVRLRSTEDLNKCNGLPGTRYTAWLASSRLRRRPRSSQRACTERGQAPPDLRS